MQESQVTLKVEIPGEYHRALLSNRGQKIQELQTKYNVQIKFPDRRLRGIILDCFIIVRYLLILSPSFTCIMNSQGIVSSYGKAVTVLLYFMTLMLAY